MLIIPAILTKKSDDALAQIERVRGRVPWIQIDVMDGTMTKDTTFDLHDAVGALDGCEVEVHIMSTEPEKHFAACEEIGASRVYFHLGEVESPSHVLAAMDPYGFTKGIALSPQTSVDDAFSYIDDVDAVQIMTVVPGAQGGQFLEPMLDKIPYLRERRTELWIGVDGGVNLATVSLVAQKHADAAGVGSAIAQADDPADMINQLAVAAEDVEL